MKETTVYVFIIQNTIASSCMQISEIVRTSNAIGNDLPTGRPSNRRYLFLSPAAITPMS